VGWCALRSCTEPTNRFTLPLSSFYGFFSQKEWQPAILEETHFMQTMTALFIGVSFLLGFCTAIASLVALFQVYFAPTE
jgi:hypothetical protein